MYSFQLWKRSNVLARGAATGSKRPPMEPSHEGGSAWSWDFSLGKAACADMAMGWVLGGSAGGKRALGGDGGLASGGGG